MYIYIIYICIYIQQYSIAVYNSRHVECGPPEIVITYHLRRRSYRSSAL